MSRPLGMVIYPYQEAGVPGLMERRINYRTGALVSRYHARQAGLDPTAGEYVVVYETHQQRIACRTSIEARYRMRAGTWCRACRALLAARRTGETP